MASFLPAYLELFEWVEGAARASALVKAGAPILPDYQGR